MIKLLAISLFLLMVASANAGEWSTDRLRHDGSWRDYDVYVPDALLADAPTVVVLHGGFGSKEKAADTSLFHELADSEGFVVVYPNALPRPRFGWRHWNSGGPWNVEKWQGHNNIDDVDFLERILKKVKRDYPVGNTVFVSGMSRGGMMAYHLACKSDKFEGFAPVGASLLVEDCQPPQVSSLYHTHGALDQTVKWEGGGNLPYPPVQDGLDLFTGFGWSVSSTIIEDAGHEWTSETTGMIWTFFKGL